MTKKEILNVCVNKSFTQKHKKLSWEIESAMENYSKQECIAMLNMISLFGSVWINGKTTEEIYNTYLQSKQ